LLDGILPGRVVGEEVAFDAELVVGYEEVPPEECRRKSKQRGVGVADLRDVHTLRAFGPEEHAADRVQRLSAARGCTTLGLILLAPPTEVGTHAARSRLQRLALLRRQLDVAHPQARGRTRDANAALDLANG
jgi:hypothetical protein